MYIMICVTVCNCTFVCTITNKNRSSNKRYVFKSLINLLLKSNIYTNVNINHNELSKTFSKTLGFVSGIRILPMCLVIRQMSTSKRVTLESYHYC